MKACNDLICIGAQPAADGSVSLDTYKVPNNGSSTSFAALIANIKADIQGSNAVLRLGVHDDNDDWKSMVASPASRTAFAQHIKSILQQYSLAGVDLDLEWAYTSTLLNDYSDAIVELRNVLGPDYTISVSLSPLSYQITPQAISAASFISLQCYGPRPTYFSYDAYANAVNQAISYGIPAAKLVPGVPFYGVLADGDKDPVAYYNFVTDNLVTSSAQNMLTYQGEEYQYNGQDLIARKAQFARSLGCYGIMAWDLADDAPYTNTLSLLRTLTN
jgi:hypothetical protein